jgi:phenylacetate-coenzyme A ligase PaaK-like adenylate-forming protein
LAVEEIVARGVDPQRLVTRRTSGSSGEPFTIRRTWLEDRLLYQFRRRATRGFGVRPTDRTADIILMRPTPPSTQLPPRILRALDTLHRSLGQYRRARINCLVPLPEIIRALRDLRPDVLGGFPGVLAQLAASVTDEDRLAIRPRLVVVGAEVMTPLMRRQITAAFSAPVFDLYGSHEFTLIAWECQETGEFHICDDSVIVEVLRDGRPAAAGERGEVVGTNLHAFAMPFIRYRLGDLVTRGSETCRCGRPFSTLREIQGRMLDYFPLPDGRLLHPYEIVLMILQEADAWVGQYQLTQERTDRVILRVVPSATPTAQQLALLQEAGTAVLGERVEFQVVLVPQLQLDANGKFRVSRSLVQSEYDGLDWSTGTTSSGPLPTQGPELQ